MNQVVCINDDWRLSSGLDLRPYGPKLHSISTIIETIHPRLVDASTMGPVSFYWLAEYPSVPNYGQVIWISSYFRPVKPTDISDLEALLRTPLRQGDKPKLIPA